MTLQATTEQKTDQDARRKFGQIATSLNAVSDRVAVMLGTATAMRRELATVALTLAEVESMYVNQTYRRRESDAMLHELQKGVEDKLIETHIIAEKAQALIEKDAQVIATLRVQADRIANEPFIVDNEPGVIAESNEYVGVDYFCGKIGDLRTVRRYIAAGRIPPGKGVSLAAGGRPRVMWLRHIADHAIEQNKPKRGIAALV